MLCFRNTKCWSIVLSYWLKGADLRTKSSLTLWHMDLSKPECCPLLTAAVHSHDRDFHSCPAEGVGRAHFCCHHCPWAPSSLGASGSIWPQVPKILSLYRRALSCTDHTSFSISLEESQGYVAVPANSISGGVKCPGNRGIKRYKERGEKGIFFFKYQIDKSFPTINSMFGLWICAVNQHIQIYRNWLSTFLNDNK